MSTTKGQWDSGPDCRVCGYKAINVRHELDPQNSPEGADYHAAIAHHPFVLGQEVVS